MYCKNCGNEILEEFGTCPYCKTPIGQTQNSNTKQNYINNSYTYNRKNRPNNPILTAICLIIAIVAIILFITNTFDFATKYDQVPKTKSTTTYDYPTTTTTTTTNKTTLKNYQQIYNEYSQKLIVAGPTSSISEMANILNEGVTQMAKHMYSASGTDGQYATYQSWVDKLYAVYMNECR